MKVSEKIIRRVGLIASRIKLSRKERRVGHKRLEEFEILVLSNEDVGRQIMLFGSYEKDETAFFKHNIKTTDICMDVGGNVGFFSLLFSSLASSGMVHVFEPIRLNASLIRTNAALNAFSNIIVNECAVGAEEGSATFSVSVDSAYSSIKNTGRVATAEAIEVPITTIDTYMRLHSLSRVDVLKVDVEGAEELVVDGAAGLLMDPERRPRLILIELFDNNLKVFGSSVKKICAKMATFGYVASVISDGGEEFESYDPTKHKKYYNVIFTV
jgi:FkbM family methyltransferase